MLKKVDRYLWRELWPTFGLALLAFLVFIGLELVLSLSDALFARGAGAGEVLRLLLFKLPSMLTLAIPAGVLLAVFLSLSRLATARELLAFQALGYPLRRILVPFVMFGLLASCLSFLLSELAVPAAESAYRRELLSLLYRGRGEIPSPQEDVFFRGAKGELYYVSRYQGNLAYGIVVYDLSGELYPHQGPFPVVITAQEGRFSGDRLELLAGRLLRFSQDGNLEEIVRFDSLVLTVGEELQQWLLAGRTPSEMSVRELLARVRLFSRSGLDPRNLLVELHSKLAVAAAALVFALFGAPLGALLGRRGRAAGAVAGFLLAAAAQGLFIWTRTLARRGFLPPSLGAWLPHILLGGLGLLLLVGVDRLRIRGLWRVAAGLLLFASLGVAAPPPFEELYADELVIQSGAELIEARGVRARVEGWELEAVRLSAVWSGAGWEITAQGAELSGKEAGLRADGLTVQLDETGDLVAAAAHGFSGSSTFRGPEKEETLLFTGGWGEVRFQEGELVRVEGREVEFTTCPCLEGAPYSVRARRFVLLPQRWLYAEGVEVLAFGRVVGWLPVYAARLGEEASPLFPELGRRGGYWFLRWHIPFSLGEGTWGAAGLTWFPGRGDLEPSLRLLWARVSAELSRERIRLQAQGETWEGSLSWQPERLQLTLSGTLGDTDWGLTWGEAKAGEVTYRRAPELSLTPGEFPLLGGTLSLRLLWGRYLEEAAGWRTHVSASWSRAWELGRLRFSLPVSGSLDQYPAEERAVLSLSPTLSLGGLTLKYSGRLRAGRSPFEFDRQPPQSRLSVSLSASEGELRGGLSFGWDLATGKPLPGRWQLSLPGLELNTRLSLAPLAPIETDFRATFAGERLRLSLAGGIGYAPFRGKDLLIKGRLWGEGWKLTGGIRLATFPFALKRVAANYELSWGEAWMVRAAGEYDFSAARWLQLRAGLLRTFAGCLRAGVEVYLGGIRFTLEVPAFPQAKARFSPLDEGLRLGG